MKNAEDYSWVCSIPAHCRAECDARRSGKNWNFSLEPDQLTAAARRLRELNFFLNDITGADAEEGFLVIYHFDRYEQPGRVSLLLILPHDNPSVPSIVSIFTGAAWHERECAEFYGIHFEGHPNLVPLLLPPEDAGHPLVKEPKKRSSVHRLIPFRQLVDCGTDQGACPFTPPADKDA